jgi:hypothetical protein
MDLCVIIGGTVVVLLLFFAAKFALFSEGMAKRRNRRDPD